MSKCPLCGSRAYIGLAAVECSKPGCSHFKITMWKPPQGEPTRANALEPGYFSIDGGKCSNVLTGFMTYCGGDIVTVAPDRGVCKDCGRRYETNALFKRNEQKTDSQGKPRVV